MRNTCLLVLLALAFPATSLCQEIRTLRPSDVVRVELHAGGPSVSAYFVRSVADTIWLKGETFLPLRYRAHEIRRIEVAVAGDRGASFRRGARRGALAGGGMMAVMAIAGAAKRDGFMVTMGVLGVPIWGTVGAGVAGLISLAGGSTTWVPAALPAADEPPVRE